MAKYLIQREFKLLGDRKDYQYVSHINTKAQPTGYDKKEAYALKLTEWQAVRVISYLNSLGVKYITTQVEYND